MSRTDGFGGCDGDVDLGEALPFETCGEGDQARVVPDGQSGDRGGVDAAGQERADGDVRTHVLGHRVLQDGRDLVVASLLGTRRERDGGEPGPEVTAHFRLVTGPDDGVAARFQAAYAPVQGLGFRHVLEDRVVLERPGIDGGVQAEFVGERQ